jgi:hypothetical protein
MKKILYVFFLIISLKGHAQQVEIINPNNDISLPWDSSNTKIYFTTHSTEYTYSVFQLRELIKSKFGKYFDPTVFHYINQNTGNLEYFTTYPCTIVSKESMLKKEGIITCSVFVYFSKERFQFELKDFYWVNEQKSNIPLEHIYHEYRHSSSVKEQLYQYGILKSADNLIAEILDNYTLVIEEIILSKIQK